MLSIQFFVKIDFSSKHDNTRILGYRGLIKNLKSLTDID